MPRGSGEAGWRRRGGKDGGYWTWPVSRVVSRGRVRLGRQSCRVGTELKAGNKGRGQVCCDGGFGLEMAVLTVLSSLVRELRRKRG